MKSGALRGRRKLTDWQQLAVVAVSGALLFYGGLTISAGPGAGGFGLEPHEIIGSLLLVVTVCFMTGLALGHFAGRRQGRSLLLAELTESQAKEIKESYDRLSKREPDIHLLDRADINTELDISQMLHAARVASSRLLGYIQYFDDQGRETGPAKLEQRRDDESGR